MRVYRVASSAERRMMPTCAKCNKKVDEMTMSTDPSNGDKIYDVRCHGSSDRTIISYKDFMEMGPNAIIEAGLAFEHELEGTLLDIKA